MGTNLTNLPISASFQGLVQISGSDQLTDGTGSLISSLDVTSSYAITASYAENAGTTTDTGSLLTTASAADATITFTKGDASTFPITVNNVANATSASFADSASLAANATQAVSASFATSASYAQFASGAADINAVYSASAIDATITFERGDATTFDVEINNVTSSISSSFAENARTADSATTATTAAFASAAATASYVAGANVDGAVANATSASYAVTASYAENVSTPNLQQVTDQGNLTTNPITSSAIVTTDASATNVIAGNLDVMGTITYISSSTLQIGDNVIEINYNKAAGDSGILTYDTTSPFTASVIWDATNDQWKAGTYGSEEKIIIASDTGSMSVASAVSASFAEDARTADSATSASYAITASYAENAGTTTDTGSLLLTASISDATITFTKGDATTFPITVDNVTSASYAASSSVATFADTATSASFSEDARTADSATSASYAVTASYAENAGGDAFPYTGSAQITGSLAVTGSITIKNGSNTGSVVDNVTDTYATTDIQHIVTLTQAEYDAIGTPSDDTLYLIADSTGSIAVSASYAVVASGLDSGSYYYEGYRPTPTSSYAFIWNDTGSNGMNMNFVANGSGEQIWTREESLSGSIIASYGLTYNTNDFFYSNFYQAKGNLIFGGNSHTVGSAPGYGKIYIPRAMTMIGGESNTFWQGSHAYGTVLIGGLSNIAGNDYNQTITGNVLIGGQSNKNGGGSHSALIGGSSNTLTTAADQSGIFVGKNNIIKQNLRNAIVGGHNNILSGSGAPDSAIIGGANNKIYSTSTSATGSVILGGYSNTIDSSRNGGILASNSSTVSAGSNHFAIIGAEICSGTTSNSAIAGGRSITISGANNVLAGGSDGGMLADENGTAFFERLVVRKGGGASGAKWFRAKSDTQLFSVTGSSYFSGSTFQVEAPTEIIGSTTISGSMYGEVEGLTIASTTASIDCSTNNFYTLTLVSGSTTHITATNVNPGQTINLKLLQPNPGYGSVTFESTFQFPGGVVPTATTASDAVDIVSFVSFDSTNLLANSLNNFS